MPTRLCYIRRLRAVNQKALSQLNYGCRVSLMPEDPRGDKPVTSNTFRAAIRRCL